MTTCRQIIKSAYRRSGINAVMKEPDAGQYELGMELLKDLFISGIDKGTFGRLDTILHDEATAYVAEKGFLKVRDSLGAGVTLPTTVRAYDGTLRAPFDGSPIVHIDQDTPLTTHYMYNPSTAEWVSIDALVISSECPFTPARDDDLKSWLALLLAQEIGLPADPVLVRRAAAGRLHFLTRFGSEDRAPNTEFY